jgi:hypothetical protein
VADGVDAAVEPMQPAAPNPPRDRVAVEPEGSKLADADDPVLSAGQIREADVSWGC